MNNKKIKSYLFILYFSIFGVVSVVTNVVMAQSLTKGKSIEAAFPSSIQFLDQTNKSWNSQRQCVSCHTSIPFAMSRPFSNSGEILVLRNRVVQRVNNWSQSLKSPWPGYTVENVLSNEAVANAVILSFIDANSDSKKLSAETRTAVSNMFSRQITTGADAGSFLWLDYFPNLRPFESSEGRYIGSALAGIAVGVAPEKLSSDSKIQSSLKLLKSYLRREFSRQALQGQLYALWAQSALGATDILTQQQTKDLIQKVLELQTSSGGWSALSMMSEDAQKNRTANADAFGTGLALIVLLESSTASSPAVKKAIENGISWIAKNRQSDGRWIGYSYNRNGESRFFNDLGTAYAILALRKAQSKGF